MVFLWIILAAGSLFGTAFGHGRRSTTGYTDLQLPNVDIDKLKNDIREAAMLAEAGLDWKPNAYVLGINFAEQAAVEYFGSPNATAEERQIITSTLAKAASPFLEAYNRDSWWSAWLYSKDIILFCGDDAGKAPPCCSKHPVYIAYYREQWRCCTYFPTPTIILCPLYFDYKSLRKMVTIADHDVSAHDNVLNLRVSTPRPYRSLLTKTVPSGNAPPRIPPHRPRTTQTMSLPNHNLPPPPRLTDHTLDLGAGIEPPVYGPQLAKLLAKQNRRLAVVTNDNYVYYATATWNPKLYWCENFRVEENEPGYPRWLQPLSPLCDGDPRTLTLVPENVSKVPENGTKIEL
ncbi:hypothetical protein M011DRAFT_457315 [Sporormia fimetaria CBS 119925]|uniref:Uncharacterized protein n=1 Tax=Sporormia fimetaria CBS 119925 TaxID=1340428 RepID=A0A6A6VHQ0_9PLEO|nr:hypothetical protein M011DRAFT_457315 [Sporormia fimetaria CBS 119925]